MDRMEGTAKTQDDDREGRILERAVRRSLKRGANSRTLTSRMTACLYLRSVMKFVVWSSVLLLIVLHLDLWFWEDITLIAGIIPIGLFYHACMSLGAGFVWYLATKFAWPFDDADESNAGGEA